MKKRSGIVPFVVIAVFYVIMIGINYNNYISVAQTVVWKLQGNSEVKVSENISSILKDNLKFHDQFIDVYGLAKKTLGENIMGKYEYVKDETGIMQHILPTMEYDNYLTSIKNLTAILNERGIPCIDVNLPDRGQNFSASDKFDYNCKRNRGVEDEIISFGVDEFKVHEMLIDTEVISHNDFFFHTDVHLTTKAEFLIAKYLTDYLTDKYSIVFPNSDIVYNSDMYDWQDHEFCGNFCGSSGKKFAGTDNFQTFLPKFETEMKLSLPDGNVKQGDFINVMTNQYADESSYWITNYGQWPTIYYTYENLKHSNAPKLLVLADSISMRTNTFLALNASHLTVFDPRYINGNEYIIHCLLDNNYDAVIICHTDYFNNNLFLSDIVIPENVIPSSEISYKGMWLDNVNLTDLNSSKYIQGEISQSMYQDSSTVFFNGWAADFSVNMPLSALYLKIGDKIIKCQYGIERTSVSDHFQNDNLKMTGFNVTIPKSYLDGIDKLEFIQVGNDGTHRFESVEYKIMDAGSSENNSVLENIDDIPAKVKPLQDIQFYGMWLDNVNGVDFNAGYTQGEIIQALYQDSEVVDFIGWAADFSVNKPLSALYLKIGEHILKCEYGIERTSVSDHFQNSDLMMTGFEISFPTEYLEGVDEIEFVQVGNNGTYIFEPVKYKLITPAE